jgi:membrane-associated protease RseP (regulator of RpoE activity)
MAERPLAADPFTATNGHALPRPPAPRARHARGPLTNVVLFGLTCLTTLLAGTNFAGSPTFDAYRASPEPLSWMLSGVPFAATLLGILLVHEFGHYFMARTRGATVSLPYFIPAPPMFFMAGTLGAIIQMRSTVRDRNGLFDIAAAGPLAGLVVALPAALLGLAWSTLVPATPGPHLVFGESLLTHALVWLRFGTLPEGMVVFTHPVADAAWFGFLVTALNLLPAGQLDGGRIGYALFPGRHGLVGRLTVTALVTLGVVVSVASYMARPEWPSLVAGVNWLLLAALIRFALGYGHGPVREPAEPLSPRRRALGIGCLVLLVLMLPPVLIRPE